MVRVRSAVACAALVSACAPTGAPDAIAPAAADIDSGRIRHHVEVLAHDSMRGRATPSRELELAAAYVGRQLASYGLQPVFGDYITRYVVLELERDASATSLRRRGGAALELGEGLLTRGGSTPAGGITAPLVILRGDPASAGEIAADDVRGRIAIVTLPEPRSGMTNAFWTMVRNLPASAEAYIIVSEASDSAWQARLKATLEPRFAVPADTGVALPLLEIRPEAAQQVLGASFDVRAALNDAGGSFTATRLDDVEVRLRAPLVVTAILEAPGVAAVIPGRDPARAADYVVLSAHMDHLGVAADGAVYNGADDNASGVATLLEVARIAAAGRAPKRPLLFLLPSGEEEDLWGSRSFVARLDSAGATPIANLNVDMIGRNAPDTVHLVGEPHSNLADWVRRAAQYHPAGIRLAGDVWPDADFFSRSDQYSFHEAGVPALFIFAGPHADYHRVSDDAATLDYAKLARVGRLVLDAAMLLAESDSVPAFTR
jgi:hypothetical protein